MIIDVVLGLAGGKGGLENVLTSITQALHKKGHDVRLFQMMPSPYKEWENSIPKVFYYDYARNHFGKMYKDEIEPYRYALGYRTLLDTIGVPDVILATHTPLFSLVTHLATGYLGQKRPPIISWIHGPTEAYGGGLLLKFADAHFAITESVKDDIKRSLPAPAPVFTVGNPVKVSNVPLIPRPDDILKLIYIGRIDNKQKRLDVLFHALSLLHGTWELHLFGEGTDEQMLKELAIKLGISNHLIWFGWRDNPWDNVNSASLLVLSSDYEGFGLVIVEALARGVPVIATNCEGPKDIIQNGINGWLYPVGDSSRLAETLQNIIKNIVQLPDAKVCVETVQHFHIDGVIERMEQAILTTKAFYNP